MLMLAKLEKVVFNSANIKKAAEEPGIYIFMDSASKPLYVGKAINLKSRLSSYLSSSLLPKTRQMVNEAAFFSTVKVGSELEALLLEARLIRTFQTKYNSQLKDDKKPLYIAITKEKYPEILTARKIDEKSDHQAFFGPFPYSGSVKSVLKLIRRVFPYAQHKVGKRPCLYSQMGLCSPCPSEIESLLVGKEDAKNTLRKSYLKNILMIKKVLSGNIGKVLKDLEKEMKTYSIKEDFESAQKVYAKIRELKYVTQPVTSVKKFIENPNLMEDIRGEELKKLRDLLEKYIPLTRNLVRIECFDVAHLSGYHATASMVTFIKGKAEKRLYRHFRIRQKKGQDDIASLAEIAKRRVSHLAGWGKPDLIIVDGGKGQVGVFASVMEEFGIPVVGIAKRFETLVIPVLQQSKMEFRQILLIRGGALNLVQRIRDEAHRFTRRYHHILIHKSLIGD